MDSQPAQLSTNNISGIVHWCLQRATAIALVPLTFWLLKFLTLSATADYQTTVAWLDNTLNLFCLLLWFVIACYHAALGLQVVYEDYISNAKVQKFAIGFSNILFLLIGLAALVFGLQLL